MIKDHFFFQKIVFVITLLFFTLPFFAQQLIEDRFAFEPELTYDRSIPSPAQALGYRLGERFTDYPDVLNYFEKLAAASPKVAIGTYGETYERRKLIYLVITSEENQQNIETIRENNLKLADPQNISEAEANQIIKNNPVIVSYSYNIHGNEASGTESAMQVAYRLAAAQDAATRALLQNTVFVMMPCINPDGRERFTGWANSMQRKQPATPQTEIIHNEPFPNGRTNHYWFDLNRDWIWLVHPESRGHIGLYQQWMPQVHVDYHEQGHNANYFTAPATIPRNLLLPDTYEALSDTFGMANIAAFDKHQINYFTRERFDFFYPGYGSSYPSVMGAIGMLTEQGSSRGFVIETDDGYILSLRQGIFDHYTTSIATLKKAAERKEMLMRYTHAALNPKNSKSKIKTYIFPDEPNGYLYEVINILLKQGVKVFQAKNSFSIKNPISYQREKFSNKTFPKGTFIVPTDQLRHLFINSVLSPNMSIEDSVMYDMSTWAAPLAYNLDAYYANTSVKVAMANITEMPQPAKGVSPKSVQYAYTIDWRQTNAPKALAMLWEKGYRVRTAIKSFSNAKKSWAEGTLIILKGRNRAKANSIAADMEAIAQQCHVVIDGHQTGRMSKGIDLASTDAKPISPPRVAMLVEPPFSNYTSGQIYFLFDQVTELPVDRIRTSMLEQTDMPRFGRRYGTANLFDYDVLILPGASTGNLKKIFKEKSLAKIKSWIQQGGILIGTEGAAEFFTKEKSGLTDVKLLEVDKDSSEVVKYLRYKDQEDHYGKRRIPGAALRANIDNSHPLAFGMSDYLFALKFGTNALAPSPNLETVGYYVKDVNSLLASGYASEENLKHLSGNAFAGVRKMGKGKVVFLLDNTQYRMFWRGPSRMMQNAVMLLR
ncbi:MAG: M14 family zinc carboxypeptidase [Bacteroidota bacterium]